MDKKWGFYNRRSQEHLFVNPSEYCHAGFWNDHWAETIKEPIYMLLTNINSVIDYSCFENFFHGYFKTLKNPERSSILLFNQHYCMDIVENKTHLTKHKMLCSFKANLKSIWDLLTITIITACACFFEFCKEHMYILEQLLKRIKNILAWNLYRNLNEYRNYRISDAKTEV